jgi:Flp pilus assembly protein TadB
MANQLETHDEPSVTSLVTGIIQDAQQLMKQQLTLFGHELRRDIDKAKDGAGKLAAGAVVSLVGGLLLAIMLALLLDVLVPALNWWGGFGIVGVVVLVVGVVLLLQARRQLEEVQQPVEETVTSIKENVEWKTRAK